MRYLRVCFLVTVVVVMTLAAPVLVAFSARPESGQSFAVILPPWMDDEAQLAALSATGVSLRDGGLRGGAWGTAIWLVQVPDMESARHLAELPALLMPGSFIGCSV